MPKIYKLDKATIDMIAAGEVVERPRNAFGALHRQRQHRVPLHRVPRDA